MTAQNRYYLPESMPIIYCFACLQVALACSKETKKIYNQILECYKLPGVANFFSTFENEMPSQEEINSSNIESAMSKFVDNIFNNKVDELAFWFCDDNLKIDNQDIRLFQGLITELIKIGFNNQSEQAKGIYKITRDGSPLLVLAIKFYSSADYNNMRYIENEKMVGLKLSGQTLDLTKLVRTKPGSRKHRMQTKRYKQGGFAMCHDEKIAKVATSWYYSRVKFSGPKEFCIKMKGNDFTYDPSNVSNEIKPCDEAMGFPRGE